VSVNFLLLLSAFGRVSSDSIGNQWICVSQDFNIVLGIVRKGGIHEKASLVDQKRGKHAGNLWNNHIVGSEFRLEKKCHISWRC